MLSGVSRNKNYGKYVKTLACESRSQAHFAPGTWASSASFGTCVFERAGAGFPLSPLGGGAFSGALLSLLSAARA